MVNDPVRESLSRGLRVNDKQCVRHSLVMFLDFPVIHVPALLTRQSQKLRLNTNTLCDSRVMHSWQSRCTRELRWHWLSQLYASHFLEASRNHEREFLSNMGPVTLEPSGPQITLLHCDNRTSGTKTVHDDGHGWLSWEIWTGTCLKVYAPVRSTYQLCSVCDIRVLCRLFPTELDCSLPCTTYCQINQVEAPGQVLAMATNLLISIAPCHCQISKIPLTYRYFAARRPRRWPTVS